MLFKRCVFWLCWACISSYVQQTVGSFVYISQLSTCCKKARSRVSRTTVRTPIEAHVPTKPYTCPVNQELYQQILHVLIWKSSIQKKAWLGISKWNMLYTWLVSNSEYCHIQNISGKLVCMLTYWLTFLSNWVKGPQYFQLFLLSFSKHKPAFS